MRYRLELIFDFEGCATIQTIEGLFDALEAVTSRSAGTLFGSKWEPIVTKDSAPCCVAKRLPDGRPVIGLCGPDCVRRVQRDEWFQRRAS